MKQKVCPELTAAKMYLLRAGFEAETIVYCIGIDCGKYNQCTGVTGYPESVYSRVKPHGQVRYPSDP